VRALHPKSLKLAGLYLAIMMAISLFFSLNIYQLSLQELSRGLRVPGKLDNHGISNRLNLEIRDILEQDREVQYRLAKSRVLHRLLVVNVFILLGGGLLSYYLALKTLRPIEEAQEAQNRFTADASHELRTPITAMRTENEVTLMNPKLTLAEAKRQLKSNIEELEKLTQLSDGLLRLASIENSVVVQEPVALGTVIEKALARVKPIAQHKAIRIKHMGPADAVITGDEASLVEALVILLDNAVKYSPEKAQVKLETARDQKHVVIKVSDQGIGIKASELPHIFERFYRADTARSKQQIPGYGLGLAIAKNIMETHGGSLTASSQPGKGSTFILELPHRHS
jgi:two-component system, OmpR family, sensor histidine kinase CiaH